MPPGGSRGAHAGRHFPLSTLPASAHHYATFRHAFGNTTADNRLVPVNASGYFKGGSESVEQLDAALDGLRQVCLKQIGTGKKVLIQW